ncbi:TPA: X-Pro dipeptidyl-peptidase, partial [Streptococcus pneumoniae]
MRFNQYSYINFPKENVLSELKKCGFDLQNTANHKDSLETFLRRFFFTYQDTNYPLSILAADKKTDLLTFFQSEDELTADIFYTVAFQLLGFSYLVDFEDSDVFRKETGFPII